MWWRLKRKPTYGYCDFEVTRVEERADGKFDVWVLFDEDPDEPPREIHIFTLERQKHADWLRDGRYSIARVFWIWSANEYGGEWDGEWSEHSVKFSDGDGKFKSVPGRREGDGWGVLEEYTKKYAHEIMGVPSTEPLEWD